MNTIQREQIAIWVPWLPASALRIGVYVVVSAIGLLSLLAPAQVTTSGLKLLFNLALTPADVGAMSHASSFPFATAITYTLSLVCALLLAACTCAARINLKPLHHLVESRSPARRAVVVLGIGLLIILPYILELTTFGTQVSGRFFESVRNSRLSLMLWAEGVFLGSYVFWLWVLFEVTNMFAWIFRKGGKNE